MTRRLVLLPWLLLPLLVLPVAGAAPAVSGLAPSAAAGLLVDALTAVQAWQGNFTQTVRDARGQMVDDSSGLVAFSRPLRLRWETLQPFPQLAVSDGEWIWFFDPDLEQVTRRSVSGDALSAPGLLLSGDAARLVADYEVGMTDLGTRRRFDLQPRTPDASGFTHLAMEFEGAALRGLRLLDSLGNRTRVELTGAAVQPATLAAALFVFVPPAGVGVLEE